MSDEAPTLALRKGQEGNRWVNTRPTADEFKTWFEAAVVLHEGMTHDRWISGITLLEERETTKEVIGFDGENRAQITEVTNLVYTPYAKVETRVAYFWAWMQLHPEWVGVIEPAPASDEVRSHGLPSGFFKFDVAKPEGVVTYVGYSARVRVRNREGGHDVFVSPPGTRIVPVLGQREADNASMMKAETGAIGRALSLAGILPIPGSGVATAEEMAEMPMSMPGASVAAALPSDEPARPPSPVATTLSDDALREQIATAVGRMRDELPAAKTAFNDWAKQRGFGTLDTLSTPELKVSLQQAQKFIAEAERGGIVPATPVEPEEPAAEPEA